MPDGVLADLRDRLTRTRWAADYGNDSWRYGVNGDWLRSVVGYWLDQYDWRAQEAAINAFPQFRVRLDGIPIHFIHVKGNGPAPLPLILTHGWPWTFWDFHAVIGPLSDPGGLRRRPGRRLRRRGALAPRLRVLDAPRRAGCERARAPPTCGCSS